MLPTASAGSQRLFEILDQIVRVFDSHRQSDQGHRCPSFSRDSFGTEACVMIAGCSINDPIPSDSAEAVLHGTTVRNSRATPLAPAMLHLTLPPRLLISPALLPSGRRHPTRD